MRDSNLIGVCLFVVEDPQYELSSRAAIHGVDCNHPGATGVMLVGIILTIAATWVMNTCRKPEVIIIE